MTTTVDTKVCPYCTATLPAEAVKCRYCGEWLLQPETPAEIAPKQDPDIPRSSKGIELFLVAGGALIVLGSFLPWLHLSNAFRTYDLNGFQLGNNMGFNGDGLFPLLFGSLIAIVGIANLTNAPFPGWLSRSPIALGAGGLWFGIWEYNNLNGWVKANPTWSVSIGFGLWMIIISSGIVFVFGLLSWWSNRNQTESSTEAKMYPFSRSPEPREGQQRCHECGKLIKANLTQCTYCKAACNNEYA